MEQGEQKQGKHFTKPAMQILLELCHNPEFIQKVSEFRKSWNIIKLVKSFDESNEFWRDLCEADRNDLDYHNKWYDGKTQDRLFMRNLEALCQDPAFGLPPDPAMHLVLFYIILCFNLDSVTKEDILTLPLPPSLARVSTIRMNNRLYLDVTFATRKDVAEIWPQVKYWQENVRPFLQKEINAGLLLRKRQLLPDLLKDIKPGRPATVPEDICLECVRLREEGWTYPSIGKHFKWPLQKSGYTSQGKHVIRNRCRTAEEVVKRGKKLREIADTT